MEKNIVLLSKSRKHRNYCVAGKDIQTGEWVRLISENSEIHNAIEPKDLKYDTGGEADLLDVVRITLKDMSEEYKNTYQPENYILDNINYLGQLKECNLNKLVDDIDTIFFNQNNCISSEDLKYINDVNSLLMVEVPVLKVKIKNCENKRLIANIKYNQIWYNGLTITDMKFTDKYYDEIQRSNEKYFYNIKIVVSLGECYYNYHYKLIATVFD